VAGQDASHRLAEAVKEYAQTVEEALSRGASAPAALPTGSGVTSTDVMITVDGLLQAADLEIFEVQIWRSLGRGTVPGPPQREEPEG
jgi:hypothetical protein